MEQQGAAVHFIATRRAAIIAVCLTGWVAVLTVRAVFVRPQSQFSWMIQPPFPVFGSTSWAVIANVGLYLYFFWLGIVMFRRTRGKEQLLVVGWFISLFLKPVQYLAPTVVVPIQCVKALAMAAALISAIAILLTFFGDQRDGGATRRY